MTRVGVHGPVVEEPAVGLPDRGIVGHDKGALSGDGIVKQVEPEDLVPHQVVLEAPAPRVVVCGERRQAGGSAKRAQSPRHTLRTTPQSIATSARRTVSHAGAAPAPGGERHPLGRILLRHAHVVLVKVVVAGGLRQERECAEAHDRLGREVGVAGARSFKVVRAQLVRGP